MAGAVLEGGVGETQALLFYNEAMRVWPAARKPGVLVLSNLSDPVDRWLFGQLWTIFSHRQSEFPVWRKVFGYEPPKTFITSRDQITERASLIRWKDVMPFPPQLFPSKPMKSDCWTSCRAKRADQVGRKPL